MITAFLTFVFFFAIVGCVLYGRKLIKTEKVDAVFGIPERAQGGIHWVIVGSSFLLLIWLYYSRDIAIVFYPKSANELCQVGKVNDSLLGLKYQFPIEEREFKSTSQIKKENKNLVYITDQKYSNTGFTLIYDDELKKEKKISKKIDNRSLLIFHNKIKKNSFVKITNPINDKSIIAEVISNNVKLIGDKRSVELGLKYEASLVDWKTEYLDLILSIKIVDDLEEAITHIQKYSSKHTDGIITENIHTANKFMNVVDSAGVFHNCSTRFADGFRYGFGAEVGISTQTLPPRGPVGLEGLVTYKYYLKGYGNIVDDFSSGKAIYTHKDL